MFFYFKKYLKKSIIFARDGLFWNIYRDLIEKVDGELFAYLFNIKSFLRGKKISAKWKGSYFEIKDKYFPKTYEIRSTRQCNRMYENGLIFRANILSRYYFLEEIGFKDEDIVLDCGANVGDLKLWFDMKNINIKYIGFEPSDVEFKHLERNVPSSEVFKIGLWNEDKNLKFFISSAAADSSFIEPKTYTKEININAQKLSNFINSNIKLLKLEAEGCEPEVIRGAGEKLKYIEYIAADLGFERGVKEESTLEDVTNFLLNNNFEILKSDIKTKRKTFLYRNKELFKN